MDVTDESLLVYSYVKRRTLFTYRRYNTSNEEDSHFRPLDPERSLEGLVASAGQDHNVEDALEAALRCVTYHLRFTPPVLTEPKHHLWMRGAQRL